MSFLLLAKREWDPLGIARCFVTRQFVCSIVVFIVCLFVSLNFGYLHMFRNSICV
jgi:hypothetical protein